MRWGKKKTTKEQPTATTPPNDNETSPPQTERPLAAWILEGASLLASIACVFAILILLSTFNNKPIPNWNGVTLNGVISVLSDLAHAALIYPVAEAIGQLKWVWYWDANRPRRISDFEAYNNASRGPFGSFVMLLKPKLWHLSTAGSVLVVLGLAMQTFLQLMPNYEARPMRTNGTASLNSCTNYTEYVLESSDGVAGNTAAQAAALTIGIYGTSSTSNSLTTQCATGNCTWSSQSSLAICSACTNVSSQLTRVSSTDWSLPAANMSHQHQFNFVTIDPALPDASYHHLKDYVIQETMMIYWDPDDEKDLDVPPKAWDCALYYCVNTYSTRLVSGNLVENITSSFPNQNSSTADTNISFGILPSAPVVARNYTLLHPPESNTTFLINQASTAALYTWLHVQFSLSASIEWNSQGYGDIGKQIYYSVHSYNGPMKLYQNLAAALTTHIRNAGNEKILGSTYENKTFVSVRWAWAALPFVLLMGAAGFLGATMVLGRKRGVPVWKNSSLPELVFGLEEAELRGAGLGLKGVEGWDMWFDGRLKAVKRSEEEEEKGRWWRRERGK